MRRLLLAAVVLFASMGMVASCGADNEESSPPTAAGAPSVRVTTTAPVPPDPYALQGPPEKSIPASRARSFAREFCGMHRDGYEETIISDSGGAGLADAYGARFGADERAATLISEECLPIIVEHLYK